MTLEDFLRNSGTQDYHVHTSLGGKSVSCHMHPLKGGGTNLTFWVHGNDITVIQRLGMLPKEDDPIGGPAIDELDQFREEAA